MKSFKLLTVLIVLLGLGWAELAAAHEQAGAIGRKNSKAGGADRFSVSCFDDGNGVPDHLAAEITDTPRPRNPAKISIQLRLPATGAESGIVTDTKEDNQPSEHTELVGGAGPYEFVVTKSRSGKKGVEVYLADFHCETAAGVHTGTTETEMLQNQ